MAAVAVAAAVVFTVQGWLLVVPQPVLFAGRDVAIFWDGIHRVVRGQVPNADFASVLGPLNWWGPAWVAQATGDLTRALPVYLFGIGVVLSLLAWVLHRDRDPLSLTVQLAIVMSLTCSLTRLGEEGSVTLHGFYRRIGAAAFVVVTAWVLQGSEDEPRRSVLDRVALALVLAIALYTKVSYFAAAAVVLGVGCVCFRALWSTTLWAGAGVCVVALAAELLAPGQTLAYFADLADVAATSPEGRGTWAGQARLMFVGEVKSLALGLALPVAWIAATWRRDRAGSLRRALVASSVVAVWLAVDKYDGGLKDWTGLLGLGLGAAMCVQATSRRLVGFSAVLLVAVAALPLLRSSHTSLKTYRGSDEAGARHGMLSPLVAKPEHGDYLRSGRAFLRAQGLPADARLFNLDLANPFSALLGLDPPKGSWLWIHPGLNITQADAPPLEEVIGDSTHLLHAAKPLTPRGRDFLVATYGARIQQSFEKQASTAEWTLYRRR